MTNLREFNLVHDPWIAALYCNGRQQYVSLKTLFTDWSDIACVNGTTTFNTICIERLLTIITLKVTGGFEDVEDFKQLLSNQEIGQQIVEYLEAASGSFCIGDPERPFLQTPAVKPFVNKQSVNTIRLSGQGKEDIAVSFKGTLRNPPVNDGIELAQFLLRENWMGAPGLTDTPFPQSCEDAGIEDWGNAGNSAAVLWNTVNVGLRANNLRETVLLNLPLGKLTDTDVAPWDRERPLEPTAYSPDSCFSYMAALTRSVLYIWDGDSVVGVYSGKGDVIPKAINEALPGSALAQTSPTRVSSKGKRYFVKAQKNQPIWADVCTLFQAGANDIQGQGIHPAPIVGWWKELATAQLLPASINYVVSSSVSQQRGKGNLIGASINELELPSSVFNARSLEGVHLFSLFKFIADVDRAFFRLNDGKSSKKKDVTKMAPLSLLRHYTTLFVGDPNAELRMMSKYPMSGQFLTLAQGVFMEALYAATDNTQMSYQEWTAWINAYKQRVLKLAMDCWQRIILSVPLSTPRYFQAVGFAHSKVNRLHHIYKKQITGTNQ